MATGHYAQIRTRLNHERNVTSIELFPSPDIVKDQTYFLSNLKSFQLQKAIFPIGSLQKSEVNNALRTVGSVSLIVIIFRSDLWLNNSIYQIVNER
jgi:tRNA-specific 2-thiouridylase